MLAQEVSAETLRIRLDLSYDGTNFSGWALQPGLRTVQGVLEEAIVTLTRSERIALTVGGRTDAGVHALNQVCHFDLPRTLLSKLAGQKSNSFDDGARRRLRGVLAKLDARDIEIRAVSIVPDAFDARFSAIRRHYKYSLQSSTGHYNPLTRFYTAEVRQELNVETMTEASTVLLGLHDFGTFCKPREGATTVRTLEKFSWEQRADGLLEASLSADAFCHSMVRTLIGGVVAVGSGRVSLTEFQRLFEAAKRTSVFRVMPAKGLTLMGIDYPQESEFARRADETRAKRIDFTHD